jgi:tetratricopeptide (TPR) repeat protein
LVLGVLLGVLFHGPARPAAAPVVAGNSAPQDFAAIHQGLVPQAADGASMVADNILRELENDPDNLELLAKAAKASIHAQDVNSAIEFYKRSLKIKDDPEVRIKLGDSYAYLGSTDLALEQFAKVLKADPKNDMALFNSGMLRLSAKNDPKGAIQAWQTLIKYHPDHAKRAQVEQMIAKAKAALKMQS